MSKQKPAIGLSAHSFTIWEIRNYSERFFLNELPDGKDFFDILCAFIKDLQHVIDDDENQVLTRIIKVECNKARRLISGILETGDYGQAQTVIDKNTKSETGRIESTEAGMIPFYLLFYVPKNEKRGILLTQTYKQFGIYTVLSREVSDRVKRTSSELRIEMKIMSNTSVIERMIEESDIKKLTYTYKKFPSDIADEFMNLNPGEQSGKIDISFTAPRDGSLDKIRGRVKSLFTGNPGSSHLLQNRIAHIDDSKPVSVSVGVKFKGRHRTLKYNGGFDMNTVYDITDTVVSDAENRPTYESLSEEAESLLDDLKTLESEGVHDV